MSNKSSGWWTSLLPGASIVVCLAGCSAWADGSSSPGEFLQWFPKLHAGVGINLTDHQLTAVMGGTVARWADLLEAPGLGWQFSQVDNRPFADIGVDLKALFERLGAKWELDRSMSLRGYCAVDLRDKPTFTTFDKRLTFGISLVFATVRL